MKRLDFPLEPHLLKYLRVHLPVEEGQDYVLSKADRFGLLLTNLLRRQVRSARHADSNADCTAQLGIDLRNFPTYQYGFTEVLPYSVYQFNKFVDELVTAELGQWVKNHLARKGRLQDAVVSFMALYDFREEDVAYATLYKRVQRHVPNHRKKDRKQLLKLSAKNGGLSGQISPLSDGEGALSEKALILALRQQLAKMPLPMADPIVFQKFA